MMVNVEQIKGKTVGMAFASVAAAVTNYVLNLLLIPRFGYIAVAYTTLAGYLLLLGLHMWMVYRMEMFHLLYSYRFILIVVLVAGVFMLVMNAVYFVPAIRYAPIVGYVVILALFIYRERNLLLKVIRSEHH